jgi:integrase/recombinase XerD
MTEERTTPLRERMIEDMRIRGMGEKAQKAHIRAIKDFAAFLKRSPDTATPEDLRAYQLHMTNAGVTPTTFNARIVALRFFFGMTCGREEMKRYMQFRTQPRKLPVVFSVEEVSNLLMAAPGPGAQVPRGAQHLLRRRGSGPPRSATSRSATSTATGC